MQKKPELMILLLITILFTGIMVGVLIGRRNTGGAMYISGNNKTDPTYLQTEQTETTHSGKLNINIATAKELAMLPGIGDTYAQNIVDHREINGPFLTIEDLLDVKGIGQKRYESISKYITVGG